MIELNKIYNVDALVLMGAMESDSIDVVIADPPYSSGGLHIGSKRKKVGDKYLSAGHWSQKKEFPDYFGDNSDQLSMIASTTHWVREAYRVCKEGAHLYIFCDWRQLSMTTIALQAGFWQYRGLVVWDKGNTSRSPYPGLWRHGAEFLIWGTKGYPWTVTGGEWKEGVAPIHNVIKVNTMTNKTHPTEKPIELLRQVILASCPSDGIVYDPFAGSGSTPVAAESVNRKWVASELVGEYADMGRRRVEAWRAQGVLDF
jgi:site-specific DNA-methyltransferase (adenine-specific)